MSKGEIQGIEQNELTDRQKETRDLFFQSYRFSQGDLYLQDYMFRWLVVKGFFDAIDVPEKPPTYIKEIILPKKHKLLSEDVKIPEDFEKRWGDLHDLKERKESLAEEDQEALLNEILTYMIARDQNYQKGERPNRKTAEQITPDSSNDPHASFIRKYVINAQPTGNDAFDELHRSLATSVTTFRNASSSDPAGVFSRQKRLISLAEAWENNHLGYTFFPPKQSPGEPNL